MVIPGKPHKLAKNSIINAVAFGLNALFGFLSVAIVVRLFGIQIQGLVAFVKLFAASGLFSIFCFGLPGIITRKMAFYLDTESNKEGLNWLATAAIFSFCSSLLVSTTVIICFYVEPLQSYFFKLFNFSIIPEVDRANFIWLLSISIPIQFIGIISQAALFGLQKFSAIRISEIGSAFLNIVFPVLFWFVGYRPELLALTVIGVESLRSLFLIVYVQREVSFKKVYKSWNWHLRKDFMPEIKVGWSSALLAFCDNSAAPYIAIQTLGLSGLGVYDALSKLAKILKTAMGLFNSSIMPHSISTEAKNGGHQVVKLFLQSSYLVAFFILPLLSFLIGLSSRILSVWLGASFSIYWQELNMGFLTILASIFIGLQGAIFSSRREVLRDTNIVNFSENIIGLPTLYWMCTNLSIWGLFLNRMVVIWIGWFPRIWVIKKHYNIIILDFIKISRWTLPVSMLAGILIFSTSRFFVSTTVVVSLASGIVLLSWSLIFTFADVIEKELVFRVWGEVKNIVNKLVKI